MCFIYAAIHSSDTMSIGLLTDILPDTVVYFIFIYHGCVKIVPYAQFFRNDIFSKNWPYTQIILYYIDNHQM